MLIWRLHRSLNDPLLLLASIRRSYANLSDRYRIRPTETLPLVSALAGFMRGIGLILLPIGAILFGAPLLILVMFLVFASSPILVPLTHVFYGMIVAYNVSGKIAREHERRTYDLLSTLPAGVIGLHWTYASTWTVDHHIYRQVAFIMVLVGTAAAVFGGATIFVPLGPKTFTVYYWLVSSASLILILMFDHLGTPVTAALISMIIAANPISVSSARMASMGAFITLQVAAYLVGILTASVILPTIYLLIGASDTVIALTLPPITLIAFAGFREFIVRQLWSALRHTVNATSTEMDSLC